MNNQKIGIFDSGLGATTALKELIKALPNEKFLYYGDSGNAPYGIGKSAEEIQKLCENIVEFFINNNCKMILIACNTAAIAAIDYLKKKYTIPIIGVVNSGAKFAVRTTKNNKIAILSTKFTKDSNVYKNKILSLNPNAEVTQIACIEFAEMIEKGWESFENRDELLKKYLSQIPEDVDTLVLGCTHYPIIKNDIEKYFKRNIVDPAIEMTLDVKEELFKLDLLNNDKKVKETTFFITGKLENFVLTAEKFLGKSIEIYRI